MLGFTFTWIWPLNFKAMEEKTSFSNLYTSINVSKEKRMITYEENKTIMGIHFVAEKLINIMTIVCIIGHESQLNNVPQDQFRYYMPKSLTTTN
jgi:hypothetical protein